MRKQDKIYILSLAVYMINLALTVLSCIIPFGTYFFAILFPISLIPFGFCIFHLQGNVRINWGIKPPSSPKQAPVKGGYSLSCVLHSIPTGIKILILLSLSYVFISFFFNSVILANGTPKVINGIPLQNNHGKLSVITWPEYHKLKRAESRVFTGHVLAFTAIPFAYFSGVKKINSDSTAPNANKQNR